jgi:hypothetical protein
MGHCPWKAFTQADRHEVPRFVWNLKSPTLYPILNRMNKIQNLHTRFILDTVMLRALITQLV